MGVKIIRSIPEEVVKSRVIRARKVRFSKPLTVDVGTILAKAMKEAKRCQ